MVKAESSVGDKLKKLVILGHNGFIGSHLHSFFKKNHPKLKIIGFSYPMTDLTQISVAKELNKFFDLETTVILLSAVKRQFGDTPDNFLENLKIITNLCNVFEEKPVTRLIYFSSAAVYGEDINNLAITEESPICPTSYYGMMKYISERLLWKTFDEKENSSLVVVRPPTIYGPGDNGNTYGPVKFMTAALNDEELTLWGDGQELREFMCIDDIAKIIYQLVFSDFEGVLNLASAKSYSFAEVLQKVETVSGRHVKVKSRSRTKNKVDNMFINDKLKKVVGPVDFTPLEIGLQTLYNSRLK